MEFIIDLLTFVGFWTLYSGGGLTVLVIADAWGQRAMDSLIAESGARFLIAVIIWPLVLLAVALMQINPRWRGRNDLRRIDV